LISSVVGKNVVVSPVELEWESRNTGNPTGVSSDREETAPLISDLAPKKVEIKNEG
jgi:hypothetical protein